MRKYLYSVQKKKKQPKTIFSIISTNVFKCCKDLELILLIFFFFGTSKFSNYNYNEDVYFYGEKKGALFCSEKIWVVILTFSKVLKI